MRLWKLFDFCRLGWGVLLDNFFNVPSFGNALDFFAATKVHIDDDKVLGFTCANLIMYLRPAKEKNLGSYRGRPSSLFTLKRPILVFFYRVLLDRPF
jgi:hypothetical protein